MKEIKLSQGKFAQVDDEDYDFLMQWKWSAANSKRSWYAVRTDRTNGNKKNVRMHRVIMGVIDSKKLIDHEDHNGLNNQRYNLRESTIAQNTQNKRTHLGSTSKYLGVFISRVMRKTKDGHLKTYTYGWRATIKHKTIGTFKKEEDAALAYNKVALETYGEFANLNIIVPATVQVAAVPKVALLPVVVPMDSGVASEIEQKSTEYCSSQVHYASLTMQKV